MSTRRVLCAIAYIGLTLAFLGKGSVRAEDDGALRVRIVASFYPVYIMALNVAGGLPGVTVEGLVPAFAGCLHDYALTTQDMKKLAGADIFLVNGAGMESFLENAAARFPRLTIVRLSEGIPLIEGQGGTGDNPHVWVSVSCAQAQVKNLADALTRLDPVRAERYQARAEAYIGKLENLRKRMHEELSAYRSRKIVTFHESFPYFAREFGFEIAGVVEREPGSAPNAQELAGTIRLVESLGIGMLFAEPQYPATAAEAIARETGAKVYVLDPAVTGPDDPDAYLRIMEHNLRILKEALRG